MNVLQLEVDSKVMRLIFDGILLQQIFKIVLKRSEISDKVVNKYC